MGTAYDGLVTAAEALRGEGRAEAADQLLHVVETVEALRRDGNPGGADKLLGSGITARRKQGKIDEASLLLEYAINELTPKVPPPGHLADPAADAKRAAAAQKLADYLGQLGGIRRRQGRIADALEKYESGLEYESTDEISTYNLSNVIALLAVTDPGRIAALRPEIERGLRVALDQAADRETQCWFHADRGQFHLLLGQAREARACYDAYAGCNPDSDQYKSTKDVLVLIRDALATSEPDIADMISAAVGYLSALQAGGAGR